MSVGELKQRLHALGISLDGMLEKSDLVARLNACLVAGGVAAQTNATLPPAGTARATGPPLLPRPQAVSSGGYTPSPPLALPPATIMTAAEAHRLAESEGVSLVLAPGNASGYKGVSRNNKETSGLSPKSGYCAQFCQGGKTCRLGSFSGAPEAALAYARHLNAVTAWKEQELQIHRHRPSRVPGLTGTPAPVKGQEQQQEWQEQANMHAYSWLHAWRAHHQETSAPVPGADAPYPPAQTSPPPYCGVAHPPVYPAYVPMPYPGRAGARR